MNEPGEPDFLTPPVRNDGPVSLAESDVAWADWYVHEEDRIRRALGYRALLVEHVGSTSVPGLAAKPVIDIVLVVVDSSDEAAYIPDLQDAGYVLQFGEPEWYEHRFLTDHDPHVQIHVFSSGSPEVERMLAFRDRLRTDSEDRDLYERTKRDLAAKRWEFVQNYADAKSTVVEEVIARTQSDQQS